MASHSLVFLPGASLKKIAIELYRRIIEVAAGHGDEETAAMFKKILADEERHHKVFSDLLAEG